MQVAGQCTFLGLLVTSDMRTFKLLAWCLTSLCSLTFAQSSPPPDVLYSAADVVFTGRLSKIDHSSNGVIARFERDLIVKGDLTRRDVTVRLEPVGQCHPFEENHSYLLYAQKIGGELWADPCAGSKLLSMAEEDLRYLHTVNSKIGQRCSRERLAQLAGRSSIVATAEVIGTEDGLPAEQNLEFMRLWRPWCGLAFSTEDAYYTVLTVLKGNISDARIVVEHPICWDTVTVDGYYTNLSPTLFSKGNRLLLFLKPGSHDKGKKSPPGYDAVYSDIDENCGAVSANDETAQSLLEDLRAHPGKYKYGWLDESVDWIYSADETPVSGQNPAQ